MAPALIYTLMTIIPAILLVVMVLVGGDQDVEAALDVDAGADLGLDGGLDAAGVAGPGYFGVKLILAFILGYGMFGFLATQYDWRLHHALCGFLGGLVIYILVYQLLKLLYKQQASTQISISSLKGMEALVTSTIMKGGTGEIKVEDPKTGYSISVRAKAAGDETEFKQGAAVTVVSVTGSLARVE